MAPNPKGSQAPIIFTIGHSTHGLERFIGLLHEQGVAHVLDVRRYPRSRRMPHFSKEELERSLPAEGIGYTHLGEELGGRRHPRRDSPNLGWKVDGFRGYADHMASAAFATGIEQAEAIARAEPAAVMCAEALWWRCHRRLVADALVARGWRVLHIAAYGRVDEHELTSFAFVEGVHVTYSAGQLTLPP